MSYGAAAHPEERHPPRVLWVTNLSPPYRRSLWAELSKRVSLSVGLLGSNEANRRWDRSLPDEVHECPMKVLQVSPSGTHNLPVLWRNPLRDACFDAVILPGWEAPAAWQMLRWAKRSGTRVVGFYESWTGSSRFRSRAVLSARQYFFRQLDRTVTVGAASQAAVLAMGVPESRVVKTQNSIASAFAAVPALDDDSPARGLVYAYVGQLIERKNVGSLIEAFASLPVAARLWIAGEGPQELALRALAERHDVGDRVHFEGYVEPERLPAWLLRAGTLVLPSTREAYGMVAIEAMALGLHVVLTDRVGAAADVRDLPTAFEAQPTVESLALAMRASAAAWEGPRVDPRVRGWTAASMAEDVRRAVIAALAGD